MRRPKLKLPLKSIVVTITLLLGCFSLIAYVSKTLRTSDYFRIKDIITRPDNAIDLFFLKGRNIFSVDFANEARYILDSFPEYSRVKLVRVLPDRIFVDFIRRNPLAYVKLYRYFAVDEEGTFFYATNQPQDAELPIILGLETKIFGPKLGRRYNNPELMLALNIIKETQRSKAFKNYKIKKIDVSSLASASFFIALPQLATILPKDLEVKLGAEKIKDKIIILSDLIATQKSDLGNIKYIDLRFKEAVIKFIDVKPK